MSNLEANLVFVVGAMKAGTSTLCSDLSKHPAVYGPTLKEPFFLIKDWSGDRIKRQYEIHFDKAPPGSLLVDGSTGYTMRPDYVDAAQTAKKIGIDPKIIIYLVRDPFSRIVSHFHHSVGSGDMSTDFQVALREDKRLINYSRYYHQIRPWLDAFGAEKVHIVTMDYWVKNRIEVAAQLFTAMGLDPVVDGIDTKDVKNVGSRSRIPPTLGRYVRKYLHGDRYRQVRNLTPIAIRQLFLRVLGQPSPKPTAEFTDEDLEFVWSQLEGELSSIAPYIRHPLTDQRTIWSRSALFANHRILNPTSS